MFIALNSQRPFNLLANEEPSRLRSGRMPALSGIGGMSWRNNKIFRIAWIAAAQSVNKELCETANTKNACFSTTAMNDCARLRTESLTWPLISLPPTLEHSATAFSNRESTRHGGINFGSNPSRSSTAEAVQIWMPRQSSHFPKSRLRLNDAGKAFLMP